MTKRFHFPEWNTIPLYLYTYTLRDIPNVWLSDSPGGVGGLGAFNVNGVWWYWTRGGYYKRIYNWSRSTLIIACRTGGQRHSYFQAKVPPPPREVFRHRQVCVNVIHKYVKVYRELVREKSHHADAEEATERTSASLTYKRYRSLYIH